jgi:hypothetical protein
MLLTTVKQTRSICKATILLMLLFQPKQKTVKFIRLLNSTPNFFLH